jgi:class 3 adenylate cyclase
MRPITALFADIVGSTGLGERLGPTKVKALVGECVSRTAMAAQRPDGRHMPSGTMPAP